MTLGKGGRREGERERKGTSPSFSCYKFGREGRGEKKSLAGLKSSALFIRTAMIG